MKAAALAPLMWSVLCLGSSTLLVAETAATGWRGDGSGRFADTTPPTKWSKESDNILWKVALGKGYSSPVLWENKGSGGSRLFLTAEPSELLCINPDNGDVLWREKAGYEEALGAAEAARLVKTYEQFDAEKRELSQQYDQLRKSDPDSPRLEAMKEKRKEADQRRQEFEKQFPRESRGGAGNAAATVACDGQRIFAVFGTGIAAAFTVDGKRLWIRHLEAPQQGFGHSASPVVADEQVIVHVQHLVSLDAKTGTERWRADVPARFGTPIVTRIGDQHVVITASGAFVAAKDGTILAEKQFSLSNNSPIVHDGVLYAHEGGVVKALKLPSSFAAPFEPELLWESSGTRDQRMASALYHDGLLFAGGRRGILEVIDAKNGDVLYRKRLDIGELFSSPTMAGGLVYFGGRDGKMLIFEPSREFREVATNESERISTVPLFVGQRMYLRTDRSLYCIGR